MITISKCLDRAQSLEHRRSHLFKSGSKGQSDREHKQVSAVFCRADLIVSLVWD